MKSVLISIQPKWCELIASGKKTVEVRKTRPKLDVPFKCYIYCTQDKNFNFCTDNGEQYTHIGNGKVIGEFICDKVKMSLVGYNEKGCPSYWDILDGSCLTPNELVCYGEFKTLYGWHISNLVIYDKPKELNEFYTRCYSGCDNCKYKSWYYDLGGGKDIICTVNNKKPIKRPPQSWRYVEGGGSDA